MQTQNQKQKQKNGRFRLGKKNPATLVWDVN